MQTENKIMRILLLMCLYLAITTPVFAASNYHYIRSGATGAADGSDWINAYTSVPTTLVRGDTYYVADGTYDSFTINTSGTTTITIQKATVADHGTDTGWDNTYGDGQAVFNSPITFSTGNIVFDGKARNESDWFSGSAYGFKIYHNNQNENILVRANSIIVKYVYIEAIKGNLPASTIRRYAIDTDRQNTATTTNILFHRMYVYGSNNIWFLRNSSYTTIEYCASDGAEGNSYNHGEVVNLYWTSDHHTSRYNKFRNEYVTGPGTAIWAITKTSPASQSLSNSADYAQIYGNVVNTYCTTDGIIGYSTGDASHMRVYNNTFVDGLIPGIPSCWNAGVTQPNGTDNLIYNNIWVNWQGLSFSVPHDYNIYSGSSNYGEAHAQVNASTSIFINYSANDFRLSNATTAGTSLSSPFNYDLMGNLRGYDGNWDRGAYEYNSRTVYSIPIPPQPSAPSNVTIL